MKKIINCAKLVLLRLIPLLYLMFFLFSLARDLYLEFNLRENFNFRLYYLDSFAFASCFVFLGIASILRVFSATKKISDISKYFACAMAAIYILALILNIITRLNSFCEFNHLGSIVSLQEHLGSIASLQEHLGSIVSLHETFYGIGFLIVIVNCFLKDKFFKTKWVLTILCAFCFLVGRNTNLFWLVKIGAIVEAIGDIRFMINKFSSVYSIVITVLMVFAPSKSILKDEIK